MVLYWGPTKPWGSCVGEGTCQFFSYSCQPLPIRGQLVSVTRGSSKWGCPEVCLMYNVTQLIGRWVLGIRRTVA